MEQDHSLPVGTLLQGRSYAYRIEAVLGQGSFGITYKASVVLSGELGELQSRVTVAVKEFFMRDFNGRSGTAVTASAGGGLYADYKVKFMREARNLSKLRHPGIVRVLEAFEANNTSYYAMEYIEGESLDHYIRLRGALSDREALSLIGQAGRALSFMHQNRMLHLDVKPLNLMRRADGRLVLIDFGLSKQYASDGNPESSTTIGGGTPGYAPLEQAQYDDAKDFPATIDVYALGATLYKMLTGSTPPPAADILNNGFPADALSVRGVNAKIVACITRAMSPVRKARYQSVDAFLEALGVETQAEPPLPKDATDEETRPMPVTPPVPPVLHVRKTPPAPKPKPAASGSVWNRYPWWMKAMLMLGLLWSGWFVVLGVGNTFLEHYDSRWPVYLLVASCLGLASCIQLFRGQKSGFWLLMASVLAVYLLLALVYDGADWFVPIMYSFGPIVLLPLFAIRGKGGKRMFFMLR